MRHGKRTRTTILKLVAMSLLLTLSAPSIIAQEVDPAVEETKQVAIDATRNAVLQWSGQAGFDGLVIDLAGAYSGMLPSEDGHYLAHDLVELQTYKDLGLSYQYIEADYLRKQLELPKEQGIIITAAAINGEGHKNGFQSGDIVLQVDDEPVDTQYDFVIALAKDRGSERLLRLRRDGSDESIRVRLTKTDVVAEKHWIIGVYVDEISALAKSQLAIEGGVAVTGLVDDGPAHGAGIVEHDIISHINGHLVNSLVDLKKVVGEGDGAELVLSVVRRGKKIDVTVQPVDSPRGAMVRVGPYTQFADVALPNRTVLDALVRDPAMEQTMVRWVAELPVPNEKTVKVDYTDDQLDRTKNGQNELAERLDRLEAAIQRLELALSKQSKSNNR